MGHLTLILAIIIYMFALVGIQLFKNEYEGSKFADGVVSHALLIDSLHKASINA